MKSIPVPKAILLDFDGIVLESVLIKTQAFAELFRSHPRHVKAILRYHLRNGGVNRTVKFIHIYQHILRRPLTPSGQKRLGERFSRIILRKMLTCRFVPGAPEFLRSVKKRGIPVYVASATPEKELRMIIRKRGILPLFRRVFGHPTSKKEAIRWLLAHRRLKRSDLLFVGDSQADWKAARSESIPFIARNNPELPERFPRNLIQVNDLSQLKRCLDVSTMSHPKSRSGRIGRSR